MDWLAQNWAWILLAVGAVWFFSRGGLRGCGMGGHGSHVERGGGTNPKSDVAPAGDGPDAIPAAGARLGSSSLESATGRQQHRHHGC